jgi:hypothetical protein
MAQADDQIRATQEELRRRNLYFGDIDGRPTHETSEALKAYQRRKGFSASGHVDPVTLRSLGLLPRQPGEAPPKELPDEPVLKSDSTINPVLEAREVSRETGVAMTDLLPPGTVSNRRPRLATSTPAAPPRAHGTREIGAHQVAAGQPQVLNDKEIAALVKGYLHAASGSHVDDEIRYLSDRVNYAGYGTLDRRLVERALRDYYARWPSRHYRVAGQMTIRRDSRRGLVVVVVPVEFSLKRGGTKARGHSLNLFVFNAGTSDPRIVTYQERRIRGS